MVRFSKILTNCINNKGYEEQFENDVVYILKKPSKNGTLMLVENMLGEDVGMLGDRFEVRETE